MVTSKEKSSRHFGFRLYNKWTSKQNSIQFGLNFWKASSGHKHSINKNGNTTHTNRRIFFGQDASPQVPLALSVGKRTLEKTRYTYTVRDYWYGTCSNMWRLLKCDRNAHAGYNWEQHPNCTLFSTMLQFNANTGSLPDHTLLGAVGVIDHAY